MVSLIPFEFFPLCLFPWSYSFCSTLCLHLHLSRTRSPGSSAHALRRVLAILEAKGRLQREDNRAHKEDQQRMVENGVAAQQTSGLIDKKRA